MASNIVQFRQTVKKPPKMITGFPDDLPPEAIEAVNREARRDLLGLPSNPLVITYTSDDGKRKRVYWAPAAEYPELLEAAGIRGGEAP